MIIPYKQLEPATLDAVLEEYILREGTDYGEQEVSLTAKKAQLLKQLEQNTIVLVYSELHENVTLLPASDFSD